MRCGLQAASSYRCTFLSQYAAKNKVSHPTSVYLREEQLLPEIDAWLSRKLDPVAFVSAVREYEAARPEPKPDEDAQQEIAECDAKLRQHRAALEAGADPVLVTSWMKQTQARRALAQTRLTKPAERRRRMTREEITSLVTEVGVITQALEEADPADKAQVYSRLGVTLTYHPNEKRVAAEARPGSIMYVRECPRGDLNPETGEISLNLDLNSKTGEKSPDRGVHAAMVTDAPRIASSRTQPPWPQSRGGGPSGRDDDACRRVGLAVLTRRSLATELVALTITPRTVAGRVGGTRSISA